MKEEKKQDGTEPETNVNNNITQTNSDMEESDKPGSIECDVCHTKFAWKDADGKMTVNHEVCLTCEECDRSMCCVEFVQNRPDYMYTSCMECWKKNYTTHEPKTSDDREDYIVKEEKKPK